MRLQYLENELARMTQGNLSISEYFLKLKTLCAESLELDTEGAVRDSSFASLSHSQTVESVYAFYLFNTRVDKSTFYHRVGESALKSKSTRRTNDLQQQTISKDVLTY
ncbi:hypothetical protein Pfo_031214 [Paulownia fortunei]|nr:hypothetical protein Pfo_031214 [Paulownia fortunei]